MSKNFTKFNPKGKKTLTVGEVLGTAMTITDQEDAKQYFEAYVNYLVECHGIKRSTAENSAKANLGYYAGYYDNETRERVERLFLCEHPIFGNIKENGVPTPEEAFNMGKNYKK